MSHQTGIKANDALLKIIGKCRENKTRLLKISIVNEELVLSAQHDHKKDWEKDYDKLIKPLIEPNTPCYILYRLDTKTPLGYGWLLLSWTPETATIRQKMLYASTKATLKTEFGSSHIQEEINATIQDETTLEAYHRHKSVHRAPAPLTMREEEMKEIRLNEINTSIHTDTRQQTLGGIQFPMTESAKMSIFDMLKGSYNYLQFKLDLQQEQIHLVNAINIELEQLPAQIPADQARYHIYSFKHTHEGDYLENFVFIYSMPGYVCTVKERMLYSSCKTPFLNAISQLGMEISKRLEIDSGTELTEEYLQDELHPKKILHRPQFAKPKGPPNRGAKRLTKSQND